MRKLLVVTIILLVFGMTAMAQDAPKAEIFGGYQFTSMDVHEINDAGSSFGLTFDSDRVKLQGWNGAVTGYFNNNFGITADFSGTYGSPTVTLAGVGSADIDTSVHTFLFGPTVRFPSGRATPFVRALFGGVRTKLGESGDDMSDTSFGMALGGGFDVNATEHIAIRVAQFDYLYSKVFEATDAQNNFRYSAGVVFRF